MRQLSFRIVSGLLAACAVLHVTSRAVACSRACEAPVQLPRGAELPGNMIYFKLLTDEPGELRLRTAEGAPIAAGFRSIANDRVFVPDEPISFGTQLVLEYTSDCGVASQFEFIAAPHGELELRPAALIIDEQGTKFPGQVGELSFVRVQYFSPDTNGLGDALMSHHFTVDGLPAERVLLDGIELIQLAAACRPVADAPLIDTCGTLRRVTPGLHTVVATTSIVGQATQPDPVTLQVEVTCSEAPDAAGEEDSAEPLPTTLTAAETNDVTQAEPAATTGCALSAGSGVTGSAAGGASAALLALLVARRRRRAA